MNTANTSAANVSVPHVAIVPTPTPSRLAAWNLIASLGEGFYTGVANMGDDSVTFAIIRDTSELVWVWRGGEFSGGNGLYSFADYFPSANDRALARLREVCAAIDH